MLPLRSPRFASNAEAVFQHCGVLLCAFAFSATSGVSQIVEVNRGLSDRELQDLGVTRTELKAGKATPPAVEEANSASAAVCSAKKNFAAFERSAIDITSSGVGQVAVQLVRLCLGDPGHFRVPLYFLGAAANDVAGEQSAVISNLASILNPVGGNFSALVNDSYELWPRKPLRYKHTALSVSYQGGLRYTSASDATTAARLNALLGSFEGGLRYQTTAADLADPSRDGIAWVQVHYSLTTSAKRELRRLFGPGADASWLPSVRLDAGIAIEGRINLKVSYTRLFTDAGLPSSSAVKFGLDISDRK